MDLVLDELSHTLLMDVDSTSLAVVNLTTHNCGVRLCLHLKTSDAIVVNVVRLEVALMRAK